MQQAQAIAPPVLPTIITKGELASFIGCHVDTLWRNPGYLPHSRLKEWGFDYQTDVKPSHKFSIPLTRKIIEYFHIDPLAWYSIVSPHLVEYRLPKNSAA